MRELPQRGTVELLCSELTCGEPVEPVELLDDEEEEEDGEDGGDEDIEKEELLEAGDELPEQTC